MEFFWDSTHLKRASVLVPSSVYGTSQQITIVLSSSISFEDGSGPPRNDLCLKSEIE